MPNVDTYEKHILQLGVKVNVPPFQTEKNGPPFQSLPRNEELTMFHRYGFPS